MARRTNDGLSGRWFVEEAYGAVRPAHRVTKVLLRERSKYQRIMIVETPCYGRMLILDGILQATEKDEFVFHEMMAHVPLLAHGRAREVLIIGGGDGGVLRETLKHDVDRVTVVEIDSQVIARCQEFVPFIARRAFEDKRTNLINADGARFLASTDEKFDVIIVDSTDRLGPGRALYTESFYRRCHHSLLPGGVMVNQNGMPFLYPGHIGLTYRRRKKCFATASFYLAAVPSFYGGFLAFGWSTDEASALELSDREAVDRYSASKISTKYYTPQLHRACFTLPAFMQSLL